MIGRQVIKSGRVWESKEQLLEFMEANWDKEEYGEFFFGRPTPGSFAEYICLPATNRFMVIMYPKKEKVVLTVCDAPEGLKSRLVQSIPHQGRIISSAVAMAELGSHEKERKGPAEQVLLGYTEYMKELLGVR
ncbi:MAG: hypothetical protein IKF70_04695 [Firmicutes bacterium]|nr:hypothetical protein [Bacillota bacterium]MBR3212377.1 hypothetical protein [Bacillota bacterium]